MATQRDIPLIASVKGAFTLNAYPSSLAHLAQELATQSAAAKAKSHLQVALDADWFDLSILAYLAGMLRLARDSFKAITLNVHGLQAQKTRFLWNVGFWDLLRANMIHSNLTCSPDPWMTRLDGSNRQASNYTPLICYDLRVQADIARDAVKAWDSALSASAVYPVIANTETIALKEYMYLLLWELIVNAQTHSHGNCVTIAGQVFLSPTHCNALVRDPGISGGLPGRAPDVSATRRDLAKRLAQQYGHELAHGGYPNRAEWLRRNRDSSFLLLTCVDDGIGIPSSLVARAGHTIPDPEALMLAFDAETSTRMADPELYDVHGLSQILKLVQTYSGYLFVQSGAAYAESSDGLPVEAHALAPSRVIPGTLFQILLPLAERSARPIRGRATLSQEDASRAVGSTDASLDVVSVLESIGAGALGTLSDSSRWKDLVRPLASRARTSGSDAQWYDLLGVPRNRQFISYLLRCLRRARHFAGMVVVNTPPEILAIVNSLQKLDVAEVPEEMSTEAILDRDMAHVLTRGERGFSLPLLLPLASIRDDGRTCDLVWLGLSGLDRRSRDLVLAILEHLFRQGHRVSWSDLREIALSRGANDDRTADDLMTTFRGICRCNTGILAKDQSGCSLLISPYDIFLRSYQSLQEQFDSKVVPMARHVRSPVTSDYLYSMAWHDPEERFRREYYQTWHLLVMPRTLELCKQYLLRKAYAQCGDELYKAQAVVSVTPSAGLLGRRVAKALQVAFYETASIYDIDAEEWLPDLSRASVLIVDDVIDTGSLTEQVMAHIAARHGDCLAVVSLLQNSRGAAGKRAWARKVVAGASVDLGKPSKAEVTRALRANTFFEVEPHTLEPIPPRLDGSAESTAFQDAAAPLVRAGAFRYGHIKQSGHHYSIYFSLADALSDGVTRHAILTWVTQQIKAISRERAITVLTIIYPYYSPVHILIDALRDLYPGGVVAGTRVYYLVAKPRQLTGQRRSYGLGLLESGIKPPLLNVALLDDGIVTGGTFASIVEELVQRKARSIDAMVLLDRLGLRPRKHLRYVKHYSAAHGELVAFRYRPMLLANLGTHYASDCPECHVLEYLGRLPETGCLAWSCTASMRALFDPVLVGFGRALATCDWNAADLLAVMTFRHDVLSEAPSPRELLNRLRDRSVSARVRLDLLLSVISDPRLQRQLGGKDEVRALLVDAIASAALPSPDRVRFILHVPVLPDKALGEDIAARILPDAIVAVSRAVYGKSASLDEYFAARPEEFAAAAMCLYEQHRAGSVKDTDAWLAHWRGAMGEKESGLWRTVYGFELKLAFLPANEQTTEKARYLVANFLGSFSRHKDSLAQRLQDFRWALEAGNDDEAMEAMPDALFTSLIDHVKVTQQHFLLTVFKDAQLDGLRKAYADWAEAKRAEALLLSLERDFLLEDRPHKTTIESLLERIAPRLSRVIRAARTRFLKETGSTRGPRMRISHDLEKANIMAEEEWVIEAITHLLANATQWRQEKAPLVAGTLELEVAACVAPEAPGMIDIAVIDDNDIHQEDIDLAFTKDGGLSAQRHRLRTWGGYLLGKKLPDGRNAFTIRVHQITVVEKENI